MRTAAEFEFQDLETGVRWPLFVALSGWNVPVSWVATPVSQPRVPLFSPLPNNNDRAPLTPRQSIVFYFVHSKEALRGTCHIGKGGI